MQTAADQLPRNHASDAGRVAHRTKVTRSRDQWIDRFDRNAADVDAKPRRGDEHLALEHEPARGTMPHGDASEERRRINAESRLAVVERLSRRPANAEISQTVRQITRTRRPLPAPQSRPDDDLLRMRMRNADEPRNILRRMLAVAVERDHAGDAELERVPHPAPQAATLSDVVPVLQYPHR